MRKTKIRQADRSEYKNYLKVAEEYLASARDNLEKRRFIPSCGDAVHAVIAAGDALTIFFLGRRGAGQNHLETIHLLKQTSPGDEELPHQIVRYQRVLGVKDAAEYGGGRVNEEDALSSIRDAERFFSFVLQRLK